MRTFLLWPTLFGWFTITYYTAEANEGTLPNVGIHRETTEFGLDPATDDEDQTAQAIQKIGGVLTREPNGGQHVLLL